MPSLLVTNDFPPKVGGIQSYLWELWRRLPPGEVTVLTTRHPGAPAFDAVQGFRVERAGRVLLPTRKLARRIDALAREVGADVIFLDPALPLGALGPWLTAAPYVVVLHGAEVTVPGRLPVARQQLRRVLAAAAGVLAAGSYPLAEAERAIGRPLPSLVIPPGVDVDRFHPLDWAPAPAPAPAPAAGPGRADPSPPPSGAHPSPPAGDHPSPMSRAEVRHRLGLPDEAALVVGVSRLVPRKGFDIVIDAVARLGPDVHLALGGGGRDAKRLAKRAAAAGLGARFHLLGRLPDADLPLLYASADAFAMCCRDRWAGLEAEGFGIVFLEAAACGVPSVAGRSGGVADAVDDGATGFIVPPKDTGKVADALAALLRDPAERDRMGKAARRRAEDQFAYDTLAARLRPLASGDLGALVLG